MAKKTKPDSLRRTVDDFVALNLLVPKTIKEALVYRAQLSGIRVNELAIMLLDLEELDKQVASIVEKELDGRYGHQFAFLENLAGEAEETLRHVQRVLKITGIIDRFRRPKNKIQN